jgi:hypothetical protein
MPSLSTSLIQKRKIIPRVEALEDRLQPGSILPLASWFDLGAPLSAQDRQAEQEETRRLAAALLADDAQYQQEAFTVPGADTVQQETLRVVPPATTAQVPQATPTEQLAAAAGSQSTASQPVATPEPTRVAATPVPREGTPIMAYQTRTGEGRPSGLQAKIQNLAVQPLDLTTDPNFFSQPISFQVLGHWKNTDEGGGLQAWQFWTSITMLSAGHLHGRAVYMDVWGDSYVTGWIEDGYGKYGFVEKYDLYGVPQWATAFQANDLDPNFWYTDTEPHGIAVDVYGSAYITGTANRWAGQNKDAWAMKLSPDGSSVIYGHAYGSLLYQDYGGAITIDNAGYAYVTGSNRPTQGTHEITFVGRLRPSGQSFVYIQGYGNLPGFTTSQGNAIAFDPEQVNLYISGWITPTTTNDKDFFILKVFASNGSVGYAATTPPNIGDDTLDGIAVDSEGQAFISGTITVKGQSQHGYIAKLNTLGTDSLYAALFEDTNSGHGMALENNLAYITGSTNERQNLDAYVVKMNAVGTIADAHFLEGSGNETGWGISFRYGLTVLSGNTSSYDLSTDGTYPLGVQDAFTSSIYWG